MNLRTSKQSSELYGKSYVKSTVIIVLLYQFFIKLPLPDVNFNSMLLKSMCI